MQRENSEVSPAESTVYVEPTSARAWNVAPTSRASNNDTRKRVEMGFAMANLPKTLVRWWGEEMIDFWIKFLYNMVAKMKTLHS